MERYCELANKTIQQLYKVTTPCLDDHPFKQEELGSVGELSKVCFQTVLECLYLARNVDQTFYGQRQNLHEQSPNGPELVTNA